MTDHPPLPAAAPCGTCPYRTDVPSGVWDPTEYAKLPAYDEPTLQQPTGLFLCHQVDGRICAGWAGCHDMTQSLGVRLAAIHGKISTDDVRALYDYTSPVPLFTSGQEAADHGLADVEHPSPFALRASNKILGRRRAKRGSTP